MSKYGFPYMGSKSGIADKIIDFLPSGKRFVDLFGGGGAMSHCAILSRKYPNVYYNEFNPSVVDLFKRAINGDYNYDKFTPEFITRKMFFELKDKDPYVNYIWSFGNKGNTYLFGKDKEQFKKAGHYLVVKGEQWAIGFIKNHYKNSYYWHIDKIYTGNPITSRKNFVNIIIKIEAIKVCVDFGDTNVFNEFKDLSFDDFRELKLTDIVSAINKFCPDIPKKTYKTGLGELKPLQQLQQLERLQQLQRLEQLEQLQRLQRLEQLQNLQRLQHLERLQQLQQLEQLGRLERLQQLEINCGSYLDYEHSDGDVVYCDPPYESREKYNKFDFNSQEFYDWVATRNYPVFFSSYKISDPRFFIVKEMSKRVLLSLVSKDGTEFLYCNQDYQKTAKQQELF